MGTVEFASLKAFREVSRQVQMCGTCVNIKGCDADDNAEDILLAKQIQSGIQILGGLKAST